MADQEDLGPADGERVVHPQVVALLLRPGGRVALARLAIGQRRLEAARHPLARSGVEPLHLEVVHGEAEGLHARGPEEAAGVEVVVLRQGVREPVADHQDHATLVAEQAADPEAHQDDQHRQVEQQVAGLAELTALGGDPAAGSAGRAGRDPVTTRERGGRAPQHGLGLLIGGVRRVIGQPGQVARGGRRVGPVAAPVDEQPRHDAADQRHHQQQVDRREPGRVVDGEQPEPVVDRRQVRVGGLPVLGLEGVDPPLGDHRPRDRAERQQEEQHEGRPHRRELPPGPAHELPRGQLAGPAVVVTVAARLPGAGLLRALGADLARAHRLAVEFSTRWTCSQFTAMSHQPVTRASPTRTSIRPPSRVTHCWWRRTNAKAPSARR